MKSLSVRSLERNALIAFALLLAAVFASVALLPRMTFAAALSVSAFTATSTNVYVNTGFATTTRVATGDTVNYQLTLSGTPLIAPQINVFLMGSTTMTGSGVNWRYSTTSVAAWTEGAITFRLGIGGTAGDATSTVTQTALTATNVTYDKTEPTLNSVAWSDADSSTQFSSGDTLTLTFSETMATSTITAGNVDTTLALSGSHTFGTSPTLSWNTAGTILTLTLGTSPTVATADTVDPTTAVKDSVGIADATATALAITDNVAPNDPTGLADTTYHGSVSPTLSSSGSTVIRYTIDGTTPTCSEGTLYTDTLTFSKTYTLKAIACDEASNASSVVTAVYTHTGNGGTSGGSGTAPATPAVPATQAVVCPPGALFDTMTGKSCTISATPATQFAGCIPGALFNTSTGKSCTVSATSAVPAQNNGTITSAAAHEFKANLTSGTTLGSEVKALQMFLNGHGYMVAVSGPGSAGNETTFFGSLTKAALIEYQQAKGIAPAVGFFGPLTRAAVNAEQ